MLNKSISKLRKSRGLTQAKFAEAIHVTQAAVSQWETGKTTPDVQQLFILADFFGITVEELSNGTFQQPKLAPSEAKEVDMATDSNDGDELVYMMPRTANGRSMYSQLSQKDRAVIDSMVRTLFEKTFGKE